MQLLLDFDVFEACVLHLKAVPREDPPPPQVVQTITQQCCMASQKLAFTSQGTFWKDDVNWGVWSSRAVIQKSIILPPSEAGTLMEQQSWPLL